MEDIVFHSKFTDLSVAAAATAKLLQSCPTLCDPIDGSPPGFPVPGILQARTLEWVAISFCNAWKWKVKVKSLSPVWLLATPWTVAYQAPPSMGFSRQEYWSGGAMALYCSPNNAQPSKHTKQDYSPWSAPIYLSNQCGQTCSPIFPCHIPFPPATLLLWDPLYHSFYLYIT